MQGTCPAARAAGFFSPGATRWRRAPASTIMSTRCQDICMTSPTRPEDHKRADAEVPAGWTFFRQWLKNPLGIAALSPSGRQLTRQMICELPHEAKRVIELGG